LVFLRRVRRLLVAASVVPSSPIVTLMKEAVGSSETSVLTRVTRRNIPEYTILHIYNSTFLNLGTGRMWVVNFTLRPIYHPATKALVPLGQTAITGPVGMLWRREEQSSPWALGPETCSSAVQPVCTSLPVATRCTACAIEVSLFPLNVQRREKAF
jgi:hypothetical protein